MVELNFGDLPAAGFQNSPAAVTIGVFDGLHRGHQALLSAVTSNPDLLPVVVTFARHPAEVLAPDQFPGFIMSARQKRKTLEDLGVAVAVLIDFSTAFSTMLGADFLDTLSDSFQLRFAAIGHDFRCGREMSMDAESVGAYLAHKGVSVDHFKPVTASGAVVSSTEIRREIRAGRLNDAAQLMRRPFVLDMSGETAIHAGSGFCVVLDEKSLLPASRQIVPGEGQYRATVAVDDAERETVVTIHDNSVRLPLAADSRIRYIVLQENRV